ncbi:MAG TPA: hypothetical protein VJ672_00445 [Gemmatimonadaceae bacterium]|nr:hypothetical protein [Gemmatimonadaceae bacterium]
MFGLLILAVKLAIIIAAFVGARNFVRDRLRFVDRVQNKLTPWIIGGLAALVALPVTWLLPFAGGWTAVAFGASVGAGIASGAKDIRRGYELPSGS